MKNKKNNFNNGISLYEFILIVSVVLIASVTVVVVVVNKNRVGSNRTFVKIVDQEDLNYEKLSDGSKINISDDVKQLKRIGIVIISNTKIIYANGVTTLTAKVTNDNIEKENLIFNIKFIAIDGSVVKEVIGETGLIRENETKYLKTIITEDLVDVKNIIYEIKK